MGYCTATEYLEFMRQAPELERMLVRSGIHLVKFWFSVSRREQQTRFVIRQVDPVRQWKLSPTDIASLDRWADYTEAKEAMFFYTDTADAPWTVIKSNDKKRARLAAMRFLLEPVRVRQQGRRAGRHAGPADRRSGVAAVRARRAPEPHARALSPPNPRTSGVADRTGGRRREHPSSARTRGENQRRTITSAAVLATVRPMTCAMTANRSHPIRRVLTARMLAHTFSWLRATLRRASSARACQA